MSDLQELSQEDSKSQAPQELSEPLKPLQCRGKQGVAKRYDERFWSEARAWFMSDPSRSISAVARQFGCARNSVVCRHDREGWTSLRAAHNAARLGAEKASRREGHFSRMMERSEKWFDRIDRQLLERDCDPLDMQRLVNVEQVADGMFRGAAGLSPPAAQAGVIQEGLPPLICQLLVMQVQVAGQAGQDASGVGGVGAGVVGQSTPPDQHAAHDQAGQAGLQNGGAGFDMDKADGREP